MYQEEKERKISPILVLVTGVLAVILVIVFFVEVLPKTKKEKVYLDNLNINYVNDKEWARCKRIRVDNYEVEISEYSFDNGVTWQEENTHEVCDNIKVTVKIRDKKQKEVGTDSIMISGIDNINPTIILQNKTIKIGEEFDFLEGVTAVDNESGLSEEITFNPNKIDTSKEGIHLITYKAVDKAGNYTTRERTVIVEN